jgi:hypothetical protein
VEQRRATSDTAGARSDDFRARLERLRRSIAPGDTQPSGSRTDASESENFSNFPNFPNMPFTNFPNFPNFPNFSNISSPD